MSLRHNLKNGGMFTQALNSWFWYKSCLCVSEPHRRKPGEAGMGGAQWGWKACRPSNSPRAPLGCRAVPYGVCVSWCHSQAARWGCAAAPAQGHPAQVLLAEGASLQGACLQNEGQGASCMANVLFWDKGICIWVVVGQEFILSCWSQLLTT